MTITSLLESSFVRLEKAPRQKKYRATCFLAANSAASLELQGQLRETRSNIIFDADGNLYASAIADQIFSAHGFTADSATLSARGFTRYAYADGVHCGESYELIVPTADDTVESIAAKYRNRTHEA